MGVFTKKVLFADLSRQRTAELETVIDTGSSLCVLPESVAAMLGLEPLGSSSFMLADGELITLPVAGVRVEVEGKVAIITTAVGREDAEPILGATALEVLGLGVEPGTERLIPEVIRLLTMTGWPTI